MKVPLSWLADFVDLPTQDPDELDEILGSLGHEVEGWEEIRPTFEGVVVASVETIAPHPDADKVRLCRVNTGAGEIDVVCGAWNFEEGAIVAYATVGAKLGMDGDEPYEISRRKIRGVESNGMICSAAELKLGDDHQGIMVLDQLGVAGPEDIGKDVATLLPISDTVLDISITPNRGDCMSILGIARELGAYWKLPIRQPDLDMTVTGPPIEASIDILDAEACPRFVARQVDSVVIGPSPLWMQLRLLAAGQRPISNVVDVSNYVMFELGHPIHTFDAATIQDLSLTIRRAEAGEALTTLDGVERKLEASDIIVADGTGAIALAGVMGGLSTEVTDDTSSILVEAANWHPPSIMHTSRRLNLTSEASKRFERGVDRNLSDIATQRTAKLIAETGCGAIRTGVVDAYPARLEPWHIDVAARDIRRLLGEEPSLAESADLLDRLGFDPVVGEGSLDVSVPTRRSDVTRPADVIEEIARLYGYDRFEDRVSRGPTGGLTHEQAATRRLRSAMVGAGYTEAQTLSFVGQAELDLLRMPSDDPRATGTRVLNPLRDEEATLRTTLLPGLLRAVAYNVGHGLGDVALFETGKVFLPTPDPGDSRIPAQPDYLAWAAYGRQGAGGYHGVSREADFFTASGVVEMLASLTGISLTLVEAALPSLHPGRAARVMQGEIMVGFVGELHPAVARDFGLKERVAIGELELEPLVRPSEPWSLRDISPFPPVRFDLAFEAPEELPAGRLESVIRSSAGDMLETLNLFDVFRGGTLGEGRKSLAYRLTFRAHDRTLTDEEMGVVRQRIVVAAAQLDARLRGG